ncbi:hypothetical protein Poly24_46870 [Rosistilla carotiformis]|uniref:Uncharacterized protein n=1 Tax=Rosistilla carotiformis TaxID=2528017 RepID=A0A518JZI3_9BACT|nr:hypothetical protein Poly24_46870 [Rosistilla carotiformis]
MLELRNFKIRLRQASDMYETAERRLSYRQWTKNSRGIAHFMKCRFENYPEESHYL